MILTPNERQDSMLSIDYKILWGHKLFTYENELQTFMKIFYFLPIFRPNYLPKKQLEHNISMDA